MQTTCTGRQIKQNPVILSEIAAFIVVFYTRTLFTSPELAN